MSKLDERFLRADAYPHPVGELTLHETHISWVILTGEFAYKLKKPVRFGFLDFSTLEDRRRDCERERELNDAMSPGLYLSVEPVRETNEGTLRMGSGKGRVIDYAVKMRQFDQEALFSRMLAAGSVDVGKVEALADRVAALHASAVVSDHHEYGSRQQVARWHEENLQQIADALSGEAGRLFGELAERVRAAFDQCAGHVDARRREGRVRDCHGDLHLGNILWLDGAAVPFDRIEFNDELRFIDVANDMAFTSMDFLHEGRGDLAWRFLNRYLLRTGDHGAVAVLRFYMVYRALVRAKVALLGCGDPDAAVAGNVEGYRTHTELAEALLETAPRRLTITCGLSGSGKTTQALAEAAGSGAVVVQTDVERKRLAGIDPFSRAGEGIDSGIYSTGFSERVYARVGEIALEVLGAGYPVIVDGAFLRRADRERFRRLAREHDADFRILYCNAPVGELRRRLEARRAHSSVSDADLAVLERQLDTAELPDGDELAAAAGECSTGRTG